MSDKKFHISNPRDAGSKGFAIFAHISDRKELLHVFHKSKFFWCLCYGAGAPGFIIIFSKLINKALKFWLSCENIAQKVLEMYMEAFKNQLLAEKSTQTARSQKVFKTHCIGSQNVYYGLYEAALLWDNENLGFVYHMFGRIL